MSPGLQRSVAYVVNSFSTPADILSATGTKDGPPVLRTVLTVVAGGSSFQPGAPLKFGDHFALVARDPFGGERFLFSERLSLHGGASTLSGKQAVSFRQLDDKIPHDGLWEVVCIDPNFRLESEGQAVPANSPVVIRHVATRINLCVLEGTVVRSQLGVEAEIVCDSHLSVHRTELPENVWVFAIQQ